MLKYPRVLFMSVEYDMNKRFDAASVVMWALYRTVVVKREQSQKAKLAIYQSAFQRSPMIMFATSVSSVVTGVSLRDGLRSSYI